MDTKKVAHEIVDEMREYDSTPYSISQHNLKIEMTTFLGAVANACGSDKGLSILYYILKNVSKEGTTTVDHTMIYKRGKMSRQYLASTIIKMKSDGILKEIVVQNQRRGYHKYMVNPYMIFNYRKTKHKQYSENCALWNILK